jgi:zinc D-Ala-D-Ala carboxypeptidase
MRLSKNLTLREATKSITAKRLGIENEPEAWEKKNLSVIAEEVFQKVRDHFGAPIAVTSGYRSKALNKAIGGSRHSQHIQGRALDLDAHVYGKVSNAEIFNYIKDNLDFDQLIWEFGTDSEPDWIHVSYIRGDENKNRCLRAVKEDGVTTYLLM